MDGVFRICKRAGAARVGLSRAFITFRGRIMPWRYRRFRLRHRFNGFGTSHGRDGSD